MFSSLQRDVKKTNLVKTHTLNRNKIAELDIRFLYHCTIELLNPELLLFSFGCCSLQVSLQQIIYIFDTNVLHVLSHDFHTSPLRSSSSFLAWNLHLQHPLSCI